VTSLRRCVLIIGPVAVIAVVAVVVGVIAPAAPAAAARAGETGIAGLSAAELHQFAVTILDNQPAGLAVDPATHRLYIAEFAEVEVVDLSTDAIVADIPTGYDTVQVAVDQKTDTIYADNQYDPMDYGSVYVIDGRTNSVTAMITVGHYPNGIAVDSVTDRVYVANTEDHTVSVIDGRTNAVTGTIPVGYTFGVAVNQRTDRIYVVENAENSVSVIDGHTNHVTATIPVGSYPTGIAVNPRTGVVYVTNTGSQDGYAFFGRRRPDTAVKGSGEGSPSANSVSVINGRANHVTATIPVGASPIGISVNPLNDTAYVANSGDGTMSVIDGRTKTVTSTITVPIYPGLGFTQPVDTAIDPLTGHVYVDDAYGTTVVDYGP